MDVEMQTGAFAAEPAGAQNDCLMNIIIENQLSRIAELEKRLEKMQRESNALRGFLKTSKGGVGKGGPVSARESRTPSTPLAQVQRSVRHADNKSESSLLSTKNSAAGPRPTIAKSVPAKLSATKVSGAAGHALQLHVLSSPISVQNGSCASDDGSPALSSSGKPSSGECTGTTRYWTKEEHQRYLIARAKYGEKDFVNISAFVGTRTPRQVRTHGEKFHKKLVREEARRLSAEAAITVEAQNNVRASAMATSGENDAAGAMNAARLAATPNKAVASLDHGLLFVPKFEACVAEAEDDCVVPEQGMVAERDIGTKDDELLLSSDPYPYSTYLPGMDDVLVPSTGMDWPELGQTFDASF
ncbi:Myb-like protein I [Porphyridium purpureum]|uniref:Myb-like protein I n=1 Tax=Porphyridium purpureum TaxID=35688 RepID=A0A5J4YSP5_PORPP|nr:Myb-like protein I [Porphyridium purpureum]|eukprot:POR4992..scf227_4